MPESVFLMLSAAVRNCTSPFSIHGWPDILIGDFHPFTVLVPHWNFALKPSILAPSLGSEIASCVCELRIPSHNIFLPSSTLELPPLAVPATPLSPSQTLFHLAALASPLAAFSTFSLVAIPKPFGLLLGSPWFPSCQRLFPFL
ncbi:unnamed protein product [Tuber aestivum]|uniref:Uncharacterized protein n=1 Tax=Tuber aestivum TaxID=59557 RepID=A0A292Q316_9PEZI|nr:unnamed protein product [Tuber aestivum]